MMTKKLTTSFVLFSALVAFGAGTPDTQWTYKTINGKALEMDVFLPEGHASAEKSFPMFLVINKEKMI